MPAGPRDEKKKSLHVNLYFSHAEAELSRRVHGAEIDGGNFFFMLPNTPSLMFGETFKISELKQTKKKSFSSH